jgi:single-strand DNA-binding protein
MSEGVNKVILLGNLGADPELKMTAGGQAVLKLRLATTETYLDRNNTRQERTEWHSCTIWGKRGEGLAKCLGKGDRIYVEGSLRTSSYEKDGEKRYRTEVNVTDVKFAGSKRGSSDRDDGPSERRAPPAGRGGSHGGAPPPPPADDYGDYGGGDDEIPF